jgi:chemotaxis protein CheX
MDADYINPFLEAAGKVFQQVLNVELRMGKVIVKENPGPSHDVVIMIGITGSITGEVVYSMSYDMVSKISEILMPGISAKEIENEYKDIVGELANMITGNALILFDKSGKLINITTPTIISGENFTVTLMKQTTLSINLYSTIGKLEMNVALK